MNGQAFWDALVAAGAVKGQPRTYLAAFMQAFPSSPLAQRLAGMRSPAGAAGAAPGAPGVPAGVPPGVPPVPAVPAGAPPPGVPVPAVGAAQGMPPAFVLDMLRQRLGQLPPGLRR